MFEDLENILKNDAPLDISAQGQPTPRDVYVAVVSLLLDAADASSAISPQELNQVITSTGTEFGLSGPETGELLEIAEFLRKESISREKLMTLINNAFDLDQRQRILAIVWRIFLSDQVLDPLEAKTAAALRVKLGLSMEAAVAARMIAESQDLRTLAAAIHRPEAEE